MLGKNVFKAKTRHLVIIGGQAAGMSAASEARRIDPELRITVVEKSETVTYGKCSMPHYIAGIADSPETSYRYSPEELKEKKNIDVLTGVLAFEIDSFGRTLKLKRISDNKVFSIDFDKLIIATGYSKRDEIFQGKSYSNVFGLNDVKDSEVLKDYVRNNSGKSAIIIGGGPLGIEMAWAFRSNFMGVVILEKEKSFGDITSEMNKRIENILKENLVETQFNCGPLQFKDENGKIQSVVTEHRDNPCDMIFYSGVKPAVEIAKTGRIETGVTGGIVTGPDTLTSRENIYACGDCAEFRNHVTGKPCLSRIASTAVRSGYIAGANAACEKKKMEGILNPVIYKIFDYYHGSTGLGYEESKQFLGSEFGHESIKGKELPGMMNIPNNEYFIDLFYNRNNYQITGVQILSKRNMKRLDVISLAIKMRIPINKLVDLDYSYTPDYSGSMDPVYIISRIAIQ